MSKAKGGFSSIVFDTDSNPAGGTTIPFIAKEGINFVPETPTEELANGKEAGAGKKLTGTFMSWDINGAWVATLVAAEDALTELFFFPYHLNGTDYYTLKNCLVRVEHVPAEAGKHHAVRVTVSGFAATQADLIALTMS